jgi:hypothetical protein
LQPKPLRRGDGPQGEVGAAQIFRVFLVLIPRRLRDFRASVSRLSPLTLTLSRWEREQ